MDCDPNSLSQAASGFQAIPEGALGGVKLVLLCGWANSATNTAFNLLAESGDFILTESGDQIAIE